MANKYSWYITTSAEIVEDAADYSKVRVHAYWQNGGWRYDMSHHDVYVYCNGEQRQIASDAHYYHPADGTELGSSDYIIYKNHGDLSISYQARDNCTSTYAPGDKWSGVRYITVGTRWSYGVGYNANGGSGAPGGQTKWYGENLGLSSTVPNRTGYSFIGWSGSDGVGYGIGATFTGNYGLTLTAQWKANTYIVSYDANGGSGAPGNQTKTYGQNLTLSKTIPTRTNYNFLGWAISKNGSVVYEAGSIYTNNSAVTLYAIWELAYTAPRISNFTANRADSTGTAKDDGTYIAVSFNWETDNESTQVKIQYKMSTDEDWTTISKTIGETSGTFSNDISITGVSVEHSYVVRVLVADNDKNNKEHVSYSSEVSIGTQKFPIDVKDGGLGVAFGKVAEKEDTAEFAFDAEFNKRILNLFPIGYIYETTDENDKPADKFGGKWQLIFSDYDKIFIGSQEIYSYWGGDGAVGKTAVVGAYGQDIFMELTPEHAGITYDSNNYKWKVSFGAWITTGSGFVRAYINNVEVLNGRTWSGSTFCVPIRSKMFSMDELPVEPTFNYTHTSGRNLYFSRETNGHIYSFTEFSWLVSNNKHYKWKRIS